MNQELTDWLVVGRETDVVHCTLVARQFVQQLARVGIPDHHTPITTACSNLCALGIPAGTDEILLQADGSTVECPDQSVGRRKRPDIPRPDCGVMRIRQKGLRVWRDLESSGAGAGSADQHRRRYGIPSPFSDQE